MIRTYDILKGRKSAIAHPDRTVVVFGEGRAEIEISIDNDGAIRIASTHHSIMIRPIASNCFSVEVAP